VKAIDTIPAFASLVMVSVYAFATIEHQRYEFYNPEVGRRIWMLSMYSMLYAVSFLLFIMSKRNPVWVRPLTATAMAFFGMTLWNNIEHGRAAMSWWHYAGVVIFGLNLLLFFIGTDLFKKHYGK